MRRWSLAFALPLALAACGSEGASAPGAVSPGEAKALDDAASMLDERRLPPEALSTDAAPDAPPSDTPASAPAKPRPNPSGSPAKPPESAQVLVENIPPSIIYD